MTGFSGPVLPKRDFFRMIRRFMREPGTRVLADRAVSHVFRLIAERRAWVDSERRKRVPRP